MASSEPIRDRFVLSREGLARMLQLLRTDGFQLVGPTVRDGAIVCAHIEGIEDLPQGWGEIQEAGAYRLRRRDDSALFGFAIGPQSYKQFFFVPTLQLWRARRRDGSFVVLEGRRNVARLALIGARSCDLAAIEVQDKVFLEGSSVDRDYAARRTGTFVVAVHCGCAGGTCFCVSMQTGPKVTRGFDLALTELIDDKGHRFVVDVGSEAGAHVLSRVGSDAAPASDSAAADQISANTAADMGRTMNTEGIKELLYRNADHPRWDDVASRCLSCTNCTLACPTCFCSSVEDRNEIDGEHAERVRVWDSCFMMEHSHLHGGSVHASTKSKYRQWLTHKLASWIDQFGVSGCVGCGRCITWCPVAIDITAEVAAIRATEEA